MNMRAKDLIAGFSVSVIYKGGDDATPILTATPVRQRADGVTYADAAESAAFLGGHGIEAWIAAHIKDTIKDDQALMWRARERALTGD